MKNITTETPQIKDNSPNLIKQAGFTLIELSIVLVIIGLIVGGVLVGQDLIKAAEIRSTIGQYEKYNTAMNAFRDKFGGMPGDLTFAEVNSFGLNPVAGDLTAGGNGNGLIESTIISNLNTPVTEPILIWQQLTAASFADGSYGATINADGEAISPTAATYLPAARIGRGNYWIAGSSGGLNYYGLASVTAMAGGAEGVATYTTAAGGAITPIEAYNMDNKLDDGLPNTGIIQAKGAISMSTVDDSIFPNASLPSWTGISVAGDCVTGGAAASDTTNTYFRNATGGNVPACTLRMRFN